MSCFMGTFPLLQLVVMMIISKFKPIKRNDLFITDEQLTNTTIAAV